VAANNGFVNVGTDHDTPVFAVTSIEAWWKQVGSKRYPGARNLFITADAGGSNGYRSHVWKYELQRVADKLDISIHVSHFPPGTSTWNKVEHRLFSFISMNWRGRPLRTYETIVNLISNTTNRGGLVVRARLTAADTRSGRRSRRRNWLPSTSSASPSTVTGTTSSDLVRRHLDPVTCSLAGPYESHAARRHRRSPPPMPTLMTDPV
jgi:hypothetical protein